MKGFNYFCATELEDLNKYLFENFAYTFFPSNFDIKITLSGPNIKGIEVFGTVDAEKVPAYNHKCQDSFIVTQTKSSFPSELEISQEGEVKTHGGLILVKLSLINPKETVFAANVHISYKSTKGEQC